MNDYERLEERLAAIVGELGAVDGVDPDVESLIDDALRALARARGIAQERGK